MKKVLMSLVLAFAFSGSVFAQLDFFTAVKYGNRNLVKSFLKGGVAINDLDLDGKTPLDLAVERGYMKMARDLVSYGAMVTTERNAFILKDWFKNRAIRFFVYGWFFMPLLWLGSITSIDKSLKVQVLKNK